MGYRIVRKPSKAYIVRSGANYYAEDDITLQNSLGTTTQDYYGALVNTVYGLIYVGNDTYLVATSDLEMVGDVSDYNQIQSMDDITPIRYGYGNQNGYVIGIGTELNGTYENGVFTVGSGLAVVQGVEIDIDTNGMTATLDTANETRYYKIFLEANFNRAINLYDANLVSYYSTVSYDEIQAPTSGEVRNNQTAYLELYRIKLNGNVQVELIKTVNQVVYWYRQKKLIWQGNVNIPGRDVSGADSERTIINNFQPKTGASYVIQGYTNHLERFSVTVPYIYIEYDNRIFFKNIINTDIYASTIFPEDGRVRFKFNFTQLKVRSTDNSLVAEVAFITQDAGSDKGTYDTDSSIYITNVYEIIE